MRRSLCEENNFFMKNFTCTANMTLLQCLHDHPITYFVFKLYYNTKLYNWQSYIDIVTHIFGVDIFNVCMRCIWLNTAYVMPNLYRTTFHCDFTIGTTPRYQKWPIILCFIIVCSVISEHDFISNFIVMVNSFSIFTDIVFIDLHLLALT